MKAALIVQLINTWDFSPVDVSEKAVVFIDGVNYPYVVKNDGHYVFTKPVPNRFKLKIVTKNYLLHECDIIDDGFQTAGQALHPSPRGERPAARPRGFDPASLDKGSIHLVELIPNYTPADSEIIQVKPPCFVVLGGGYYRITDFEKGKVKIKNPGFKNIEGRRFLLRDTKNKAEEIVIIEDCVDTKLCEYKVNITGDYAAKYSVLFPAFYVAGDTNKVPVKKEFTVRILPL